MSVQHFKHTQLAKLREENRRTIPALSDIGKTIASNDGYVLTEDGRILLRLMVGSNPTVHHIYEAVKWVVEHMPEGAALTRQTGKDTLVEIINSMDEFPRGSDTSGVTPDEAYAYISRMTQLDFIEGAAIVIQRKAVLMERALRDMLIAAQAGKIPTPKEIVAAATALREAAE